MTQARSGSEVARLLDLSRYAEADSSARALLALDPESTTLHRLLASALIGLERPTEAIEAARTACRLAPDDAACLVTLSRAEIAGGRVGPGLEAARRAVSAAPHSASTHFGLSQAFLAAGNATGALTAADEAVRLSPGSAQVHNLRGMCLDRAGRRAEARTAYQRALALDPQNALAMNNLAAMDVLRNPLRAVRGLTAAASADPQQRVVHHNLVVVTHNLVFQLRWVVLGGGLVEVALAYGGAPRWTRLLGLVLLASLVLGIVVQFVRALPRGTRRSPRALFASLKGRTTIALLYLALAGVIVVEVAVGTGEARDTATRWLVQLLVIGLVVMAVQRRRRTRRGDR